MIAVHTKTQSSAPYCLHALLYELENSLSISSPQLSVHRKSHNKTISLEAEDKQLTGTGTESRHYGKRSTVSVSGKYC